MFGPVFLLIKYEGQLEVDADGTPSMTSTMDPLDALQAAPRLPLLATRGCWRGR